MSPKKSSKNRSRKSSSRQGLSGNPQVREQQLEEQAYAWNAEHHVHGPVRADDYLHGGPAGMFGSDGSLFQEVALRSVATPAPWWPESHHRIITRARAASWPADLLAIEAQAGQIVGDEFYERLNAEETAPAPSQWLGTLAEATGTALLAGLSGSEPGPADDWPNLWSFLCGLALISPLPLDDTAEQIELIRNRLPELRLPLDTALVELGKAVKVLADLGLTPPVTLTTDGPSVAGPPLVAQDAYGSRFLIAVPFAHTGPPAHNDSVHIFSFDIDACWLTAVVAARSSGSMQEALAAWRADVGPAAATAELAPCPPDLAIGLLGSALEDGPLGEMLDGSEPRDLMHEFYRLHRRAQVVADALFDALEAVPEEEAVSEEVDPEDPDALVEAFLDWHAARHGDSDEQRESILPVLDTLLAEWGPVLPIARMSFSACSPHRIEMTARLIRDGNVPSGANAALRLLPEWTEWCVGQSGLAADFAARSREAAAIEALNLLPTEQSTTPRAPTRESPFRRPE